MMASASISTEHQADMIQRKVATLPTKLNNDLDVQKPDTTTVPEPGNSKVTARGPPRARSSMPTIASALQRSYIAMLSKPMVAETDKPTDPLESDDNPHSSKDDQPNEDEANSSMSREAADGSKALRVFSKVAALPSLLADRVKSTQAKQMEDGDLINLTFLNEQEMSIIQKVIQADLKLRRNILGLLKSNIDRSVQTKPHEALKLQNDKSNQMSCVNCDKNINLICTRLFTGKCSDCGRMLCKQCTGQPTQQYDWFILCLSCKNGRSLRLQTLDYESILHYGVRLERRDSDIPTMSESELVKKSLQAAKSLSRPRKSVEFTGPIKSASISISGSLPRNEKLKSLGKSNSFEAESIQQPPRSLTSPHVQARSKSLTPNDTRTIPRITDTDCGYKLMSKASDESLVDLSSVYSEQCYFGVEISGQILLGVWYKPGEKRLYVRIIKAENLSEAADGALDPYVKTYLLPGMYKSNKRKTGLQYDTTKPVWNEILKYADLTQDDVRGRILWVSVWDWNRYGRQQFLGEVRVPLGSRDLTNSKDEWFSLQDSENKPSFSEVEVEEVDSPDMQTVKPRLLVALMFNPYTVEEQAKLKKDKKGKLGCLHIKIVRAENLPAMDVNDRTDSFARCFLFPNLQLGGKKKTKIVENSLNPAWEEELIYSYLSMEELQCERVLEVTLWDYDRRGTNQFIGGIRIGPNPFDVINSYDWLDSTNTESVHWEDMLDRPGEWVEHGHPLRPSMDSMHKLKSKLQIPEGSISSGSLPLETPATDGRDTPTISSPVPEANKSLEVNITRSKKGNYQISGEVLVGIKYTNGLLYLKIVKAAGLTAVYRNGVSNPYIKLYLLPDRSKDSKKKTEVKPKSLNPVFKEVFKYQVDPASIHLRSVWITVWNQGSFGTNSFMGETCISLTGNLRHSSERWYELHDFAESGMVVMATPFGNTPTHHLPQTLSRESSPRPEGGSPPLQASTAKPEGGSLPSNEPPPPLQARTPQPEGGSLPSNEPLPPLQASTAKPSSPPEQQGEDVPDTTPITTVNIPTVNVEDFEATQSHTES